MLQNKKILLAITGSIAAYKSAVLLRLLIKAGAEVQVLMTEAAARFVAPLTLSTLSRRPVLQALSEEDNWNNHVHLGRWADVMLIAPASANTLAKMAGGICDNLVQAVYLSAACPVVFAPAMDEDMWHHAATRYNLQQLLERGHRQLPVETGELASGLHGEGRMAEPEVILQYLADFLSADSLPLAGKRALVTAGPTYEPLDPVRFIGNRSSGKMGIAVAQELARKGAEVTLVLGPVSEKMPQHDRLQVIPVQTAEEMRQACLTAFPRTDIAVLAAAVADYRPVQVAAQKIKKKAGEWTLALERTPDILKELGTEKKPGQILAGFSLETHDEEKFARQKLQEKNLDMIILNSLRDEGAGFGYDTNKISIITANGEQKSYPLKPKPEVARDIVASIISLYQDA